MAYIKITDEQFKVELEAGLSLYEIAEKYDMTVGTLYQKRKQLFEDGIDGQYKPNKRPYLTVKPSLEAKLPVLKKFDLRVGDIVTDSEPEINKNINKYEVIAIHPTYYTCKKISGIGHWTTCFLKIDYQMGLTGRKRFNKEKSTGGKEG